jgi:hypothetical protein
MPTKTDIAVDRRRARDSGPVHPELRATKGTGAEHLRWAMFLAVRALTAILRIPETIIAWTAGGRLAYVEAIVDREHPRGTISADLVVRFLEGRFAERQPDIRSGLAYRARWIGCTARGTLTERHNMLWSPDPLPGDPEAHAFELNHAGDAATIHLRNIWRSGLIVRSRYGTAWFVLGLTKGQIALRIALALAVAATLFTALTS